MVGYEDFFNTVSVSVLDTDEIKNGSLSNGDKIEIEYFYNKELAKENNVPIVENKPLARALYAAVEVGGMVPAELYQAVAEVLAYVYRLKNRRRRA